MAKMAVAARAMHLGAAHEEATVDGLAHGLGAHRLPERRPPRAAVELGRRVEKRRAASRAEKGPLALGEIVMGEGALGPVLAHDLVAEIAECRAPFGIRLDDFVHFGPYRRGIVMEM
jgi:hypothetical protein